MSLSVSTLGDNSCLPGINAETYIPDQLIAGNMKLVTQPITLAAGTLPRGSVLGLQSGTPTSTAKAGNTGNGTLGSLSAGGMPVPGIYVLRATSATNFTVSGPDGSALPNATVATPYISANINFTLTAGGTAFAPGDEFTITVPAAGYVLSVATAADGSEIPCAILVDAADASGGAVGAGAYMMGEFNGNYLNYDPSWSLASLTASLRAFGIFVKNTVSAADPS